MCGECERLRVKLAAAEERRRGLREALEKIRSKKADQPDNLHALQFALADCRGIAARALAREDAAAIPATAPAPGREGE